MNSLTRSPFASSARRQTAFSLVEVCLALGLTVFAISITLGVLPIGLQSIHHSATQQGISNLARQIRTEFAQVSFNPAVSPSLADLESQNLFYTQDGILTDETHAFFMANLRLESPTLPEGSTSISSSSGRNVVVRVSYPISLPESGRSAEFFSVLLARQDGM